MAFGKEHSVDPNKTRCSLFWKTRKWLPVVNIFEEGKFFARHNGQWVATPMFVVC
ncbi:MAG: hypothetical protein R3C26_17745 [Calditrichia bacterium]